MAQNFNKIHFIFLLCLGLSSSIKAAELEKISFPETIEVDGKTLKLNGLGKREATIFKVNVYVAGLYLVEKSSDAEAILKSTESKKIRLVFMRNLKKSELVEAFKDNLPKNCWTDCEKLKGSLSELEQTLVDVQKGDEMAFTTSKGLLRVEVKGRELQSFKDEALVKNFFGAWLGPKPPNTSLKEGLLGLKK